jgi:hypothetical protein
VLLEAQRETEKLMKDPKSTVRYLGCEVLSDGSRRLDFSFAGPDSETQFISVKAAMTLFSGPDHLSIQECTGICYETLKYRIVGEPGSHPASIKLTSEDIAQHRKPTKTAGRRPAPTSLR